ncbi:MAG: VapC toxin family PIN domain ribonuclease, partial [Solirubrobacteraceae bacterium]
MVEDDARQTRLARAELDAAETVALTTIALCELVWVLRRGYRTPRPLVADTLRRLISAENISVDRQVVEAGLTELEAGGDFADGVIAFEGRW